MDVAHLSSFSVSLSHRFTHDRLSIRAVRCESYVAILIRLDRARELWSRSRPMVPSCDSVCASRSSPLENFVSAVWIMLASIKRADDFLQQPMPTMQ